MTEDLQSAIFALLIIIIGYLIVGSIFKFADKTMTNGGKKKYLK